MTPTEGGWALAAALALLGSLWVGGTLHGARLSTAPDGSRPAHGTLLGRGCDRVPARQARIASAALTTDEILLELLPRERWEAVSYVVDWPRATPVSGRFDPGLVRTRGTAEHLLGLDADRILVTEYNSLDPSPHLVSAGRCVAELAAPRSVAGVLAAITWVGEVTGTEPRAAVLVAKLQRRLERLPKPTGGERLRALVLQGLMVYGDGTLQGDCLARAGLRNVAHELGLKGTPTLGAEELLRLELDLLFVAACVEAPRPATAELMPAGVLWRETPVMKKGRVIAVPETWTSSLSHHALRACEAYAKAAVDVSPPRLVASRPEGSRAQP